VGHGEPGRQPNRLAVVFDQLEKGGIQIVCDEDVAQETISDKPTCFVTLELPFPVTDADRDFWKPEGLPLMGFQPLILFADANSDTNANGTSHCLHSERGV
jgi:hypothetical protein